MISKLCALILNFVFFNIGVSFSDPAWAAVAPTWYWTQIAVCTLHYESIIARGSCAARAAASAAAPAAAAGVRSDQQSTSAGPS
jgi:hypothetical protein